jgi:hypothetical protein
MWDLANYVGSVKPVWEMNAEEVAAFYRQQDADAGKPGPARRIS